MKRLYGAALVLSLLLASVATALPPNWEWQNPTPTVNDILDVTMVTANTGWAVGLFGTILKTTDGGGTWQYMPSPTSDHLESVCFADEQYGWIGGYSSFVTGRDETFVLRTTDGGQSWSRVALEASSAIWFRDLQFLDRDRGWAVTGDGQMYSTLLYTRDGGLTWTERATSGIRGMRQIQFLDDSTGWALGTTSADVEAMRVLRTTNGGASWNVMYSVGGDWLYGMYFHNALDGWVVGEWGWRIHTTDGGLNWHVQTDSSFLIDAVTFADDLNGFAIGYGDSTRALRTTDGGATWEISATGTHQDMQAIAAVDASHAVAVGRNGSVVRTEDGETWSEVSRHQINQMMGEISFADSLNGWVGGITLRNDQWPGSVWHTVDGGLNWTEQIPGILGWVDGLSFVDANNGWAVGTGGGVSRTTDGGDSWTTQILFDTNSSLLDVNFCDTQHGAVVGYQTIWQTVDGGLTWVPRSDTSWGEFMSVKSVSPQVIWAVGVYYGSYTHDSSMVVHTSDGGDTWETEHLPNARLTSVDFFDESHGCITGEWYNDHSQVFYTVDGGTTWTPASDTPILDFEDVAFQSQSELWGAANGGSIAHSTDGGATWTAESAVTNGLLVGLSFGDPHHGWILGQMCTIIRYRDAVGIEPNYASDPVPTNVALTASPNPFNPVTTLTLSLGKAGRTTVKIYDVTGRLVETLCDEVRPAGVHALRFDGSPYASGVYFARIETPEINRTLKLLLLK